MARGKPSSNQQKDSPTRAPQSGDPKEAGRSRGKVRDEGAATSPKLARSVGRKTDDDAGKGSQGRIGEDLESGRHEAAE